jgi:hypothetical protein
VDNLHALRLSQTIYPFPYSTVSKVKRPTGGRITENVGYAEIKTGVLQKYTWFSKNYSTAKLTRGHAVAQLVEALRNMPEGRGFDSRRCRDFSLT